MTIFFSPQFRIFILPALLAGCHLLFNRHVGVQYFSVVEVFCFALLSFLMSTGLEWSLNKLRFSPTKVLFTSAILPFALLLGFLAVSTYYFDLSDNFFKIQWNEMTSVAQVAHQLQNWYQINSAKSVHMEIFLMTVANFVVPVFLFQMAIAFFAYTFKSKI